MAEEEKKPHRWVAGQASPNPYGRPKGSPNKRKEITKNMLWNIFGKLVIMSPDDILKMKPSERIRALIQIAPHFAPKAESDSKDEADNNTVKVIIKYEDKKQETEGDYEQLEDE
ncbi:MAG: hypothetical protein QM737_02790 [Ferruginibacter sp.]